MEECCSQQAVNACLACRALLGLLRPPADGVTHVAAADGDEHASVMAQT